MSQVRTRRARAAAAASAAVVAGGLALGLLAGGGGGSTVADGTVVSNVIAPVVPVTAAVISDTGIGDSTTAGTRMG